MESVTFENGKIIVGDEKYEIEHITAIFEEDMPEVEGVVRCTGVEVESDAPSEYNSNLGEWIYNKLADREFPDPDGEMEFEEDAKDIISDLTGVDTSQIRIERQ